RDALPRSRHAVVLGAGLIGMHAAENLAKSGARVTVIELAPHVLPGYFDSTAAALIQDTFAANGVEIRTGVRALAVRGAMPEASLALSDGRAVPCDLLVVGVG